MIFLLLINGENNTKQSCSCEMEQVELNRQIFIRKFMRNKLGWKNVLYIHIPFCKTKCKFCVYGSKEKFLQEEQETFFTEILPKQMENYKEILENVSFDEVFVGGGTPTTASVEQLDGLFKQLKGFKEIPVKCIEASPETITHEHLKLFQDWKFQYVSLGIQTLTPEIAMKNKRYCLTERELSTMSIKLKESGLFFNYDMICYLDHGDIRDLANFKNDLTRVMKAGPSSVTIHQLYQIDVSEEKTKALIELVKEMLVLFPEYKCVNSDLNTEDAFDDSIYSAEYRLVREKFDFSHYLYEAYSDMPVQKHNVLSLGFHQKFKTISNVGPLVFDECNNLLYTHEFIKQKKEMF